MQSVDGKYTINPGYILHKITQIPGQHIILRLRGVDINILTGTLQTHGLLAAD